MGYRLLLLRWLTTTFLTALQVVTAKIYQAKGNFTSAQKSAFSAIMLALASLLSINFVAGFKELAKAFKHPLKKRFDEDSEERRLIDQLESFGSVLKLLRRIWDKPGLRLLAAFCACWLSLNIAAPIAIGATGLTYSVNDGTNYKDIYTKRGNSTVPDLSCYHKNFNDNACHNQVTVQTIAHSYGETILAFNGTQYKEVAEILQNKELVPYFHRKSPNQQQVAFRFNEYNSKDTQKTYPHLTERVIYAEALNCITYNQTSADKNDPQTLNMTNADDAGDNQTITIPRDFLGQEGTTYIYRGFHAPPAADLQSCGDRCLWMWAYRNPSGEEPPAFYKCPVNVSNVMNAPLPEHQISDHTAKMAAAATAMHGGYRGPVFDDSEKDWTSYQFYASGSPWDVHNHTADYVGDRFALFALGSLATMANLNPLISVQGDVPYLGHSVETYEPGFLIIWACIVGVHLAVFIATVLSERRAERETPGQELQKMNKRAEEGDESSSRLVEGESGGEDVARVEDRGSVRQGLEGSEVRGDTEEQGTPDGERGFCYV